MTFDWMLYRGNLEWLPKRTIYISRHGSHAYGTSTPTSDIDMRGIAVAPQRYYLGFAETFEQAVQHDPIDLTIFEIRKFMKLAADANPNALEILFTDPSDHLLVHPAMELLLDERGAFLSRKAKHTFSGYATSQMKRINAHYRWLKHPPKAPPMRSELGLPERTVIPADQHPERRPPLDPRPLDQMPEVHRVVREQRRRPSHAGAHDERDGRADG